jgi:predicted DNA-binding transcriptional regulator AlpA
MTMKNFPHPNLLTTKEICDLIGVSNPTLYQWKKLGLIAPVMYRGRFPLWEKIPQCRIDALWRDSARRKLEGARKGNRVSAQNGTLLRGIEAAHKKIAENPEILRKGREKRFSEQEQQAPEGALDRTAFSAQTGLGIATIDRYVRKGWIVPLHVDPKWRKAWFAPMSPEQVEELRQKAKEAIRESARGNIAKVLEQWHGGGSAAHRESFRPSPDHLTVEEVAKVIGEAFHLVASATKEGTLPKTKLGRYIWVLRSDVEPWNKKRLASIGAKSDTAIAKSTEQESRLAEKSSSSKSKPAPKKQAELPRFANRHGTIHPVQDPPLRDFAGYDAAVEAGKANPAYQGPMGFNIHLHSKTGAYRSAPVSVNPQDGWNYHQRHYRNGFGQWQMRTMSRYGEVHL